LHISTYSSTNNSASLTATNTLADPDGMTNFVQYQWQRLVNGTWTNIAGATTATLANQSGTTVRVTSSYSDPFGNYTFVSNETAFITGTNNANTIVGTAGADVILGLSGSDTLTGGAGNDTVDGGTGADVFLATVNDGNDVYIGGTGNDTYNLSATSTNADVNLTTGIATSTQIGTDTLTGIENVIGSTGNNTITDGVGSNRLEGLAGNDTFNMTADNASDTIVGGTGNDTISYAGLTTNLSVTLNTFGNATVNGSGTTGNNDVISGIENFTGGLGNDSITGDLGINVLNGGGGNDIIRGGYGADNLTGGSGNDTFVVSGVGTLLFESAVGVANRDVITDFTAGDKIDLSGIDARTGNGNAGDQAFTWLGTNPITNANSNGGLHYYYDTANNLTIIEGSNNANNAAVEFQIALIGNISLQATDFIL
jgi:Ca2+-binding RTX toxin-like protein